MRRTRNLPQKCMLPILLLMGLVGQDAALAASDDIPNLTGTWLYGRCEDGSGTGCYLLAFDDEKLTQRAKAFRDAFDEVAQPKFDCAPMSIPHIWTDPYGHEIQQQEDRVTLIYEKDDVVRTVWLDGHGHQRPALNQFFYHGYSTGHYEGDTLVVETTRFSFDPMGLNSDFRIPSSSQKRVTERYTRDGETLILEVTTEDTFFLEQPWTYKVRSQPSPDPLALPWGCDLESSRQILQVTPTIYPEDPPIVRIEE